MWHTRRLVFALPSLIALAIGVVVGAPAAVAVGGFCGGAIPCDCGDRVSASRTLVPGVDPITTRVCPADGLRIIFQVDEPIVLDLGGATISGSGEGNALAPERGIFIDHSLDVTVTGGRVRGFDIGIEGSATSAVLVSDIQVTDNTLRGIYFDAVAPNHIIERCLVRNNGGPGIEIRGFDNVVRLCRAEWNGSSGIIVDGRTEVTGNWALRNDGDGFAIAGGATVNQNRSTYNGGTGFRIRGLNTLTLNNALANGEDGFTVSGGENHIARNRSDYNRGVGVGDTTVGPGTGGTANTYVSNRCTGNARGKSAPSGLCR